LNRALRRRWSDGRPPAAPSSTSGSESCPGSFPTRCDSASTWSPKALHSKAPGSLSTSRWAAAGHDRKRRRPAL